MKLMCRQAVKCDNDYVVVDNDIDGIGDNVVVGDNVDNVVVVVVGDNVDNVVGNNVVVGDNVATDRNVIGNYVVVINSVDVVDGIDDNVDDNNVVDGDTDNDALIYYPAPNGGDY